MMAEPCFVVPSRAESRAAAGAVLTAPRKAEEE